MPKVKLGMSEERLMENVDYLRERISFWREYPDLFVDFLKGPDSTFEFLPYQRIYLRVCFRYKYVYATFCRAFSKSFMAIMALTLKCVLYPGAKIFICSGTKDQAGAIASEKLNEIFNLVPGLRNEINEKKSNFTAKDYIRVTFKNGSILDVVGVKNSSRGGRRHSGLIDEVIMIDGTTLNEVILPMLNVSRRLPNGEIDNDEVLNKGQIYCTSAGYKNTFSYDKLIQLLIWQIIKPGSAFVMGGNWRLPVKMGLLDKNFVQELKNDGTYDEMSFEREYKIKSVLYKCN